MADELYFSSEGRLHQNTDDLYDSYYINLQPMKDVGYIPPTFVTYNVTKVTQEVTKDVVLNKTEIQEIVNNIIPNAINETKEEITSYVLNNINNNMRAIVTRAVQDAIEQFNTISNEELDNIIQ